MPKKTFKNLLVLLIISSSINAAYKGCSQEELKEKENDTNREIEKYELCVQNHVLSEARDTIITSVESITDDIVMLIDSNAFVWFKFSDDKIYKGFDAHVNQNNATPVLLKFDDKTLISAVDNVIKIWNIDFDKLKPELFNQAFTLIQTLKCPHSPIEKIKKFINKLIQVKTRDNHIEFYDIENFKHIDMEGEIVDLEEDVNEIRKQILDRERQLPENKFKDKEYQIKFLLKITKDIYAYVIDNKEESVELNSLHRVKIWDLKNNKRLPGQYYPIYSPVTHLFKVNDNIYAMSNSQYIDLIAIDKNKLLGEYTVNNSQMKSLHTVNNILFISFYNNTLKKSILCSFKPVYAAKEKLPSVPEKLEITVQTKAQPQKNKCCAIL